MWKSDFLKLSVIDDVGRKYFTIIRNINPQLKLRLTSLSADHTSRAVGTGSHRPLENYAFPLHFLTLFALFYLQVTQPFSLSCFATGVIPTNK